MDYAPETVWGAFLNAQILPIHSDPTQEDTDGDGVNDEYDATPLKRFNSRFINSSDMVDIFTNYDIEEKIKQANLSYDSLPFIEYYAKLKKRYMSYLRAKMNVWGGDFKAVGYHHASEFLSHFLDNTGSDYIYDATEIITGTNCGKKFYIKNINSLMEVCEETVVDELCFYTNPKVLFSGTNFSTTNCANETVVANDWWFCIGDSYATISIKCEKTGDYYSADVNYNIIDFYDWEDGSFLRGGLVTDGEMYKLHQGGLAKEFKSIGIYKTKMTWQKGVRMDEKTEIPN